ncbi:MAG: hypothetical protein LBT46_11975 [Planctomycetaceae bacterium]|jgi:hypothetical protein|nr:hypothetical protein [Planctomycetaceae bacterium]
MISLEQRFGSVSESNQPTAQTLYPTLRFAVSFFRVCSPKLQRKGLGTMSASLTNLAVSVLQLLLSAEMCYYVSQPLFQCGKR